MNEKILCVDDDAKILDAFQRILRNKYAVFTANGGDFGLKTLVEEGPFAVVLSDQRMPGMDGVQFLSKTRDLSPDSVRMMLTGYGDLNTAMDAVNEGQIFRFLLKPCPYEKLVKAISAGIEQYRLILAQRELLENTLTSSIEVLTEALSLSNPLAFSRANRLKDLAGKIAHRLELKEIWRYEIAAMLSQIGFISIPAETLEKYLSGEALSEADIRMIDNSPRIGEKLIQKIPRLEAVSEMIRNQRTESELWGEKANLDEIEPSKIGAQIIRTAIDFDLMLQRGTSPSLAIQTLVDKADAYFPRIVSALAEECAFMMEPEVKRQESRVNSAQLTEGMILADDVRTVEGILLVKKGYEINLMLHQRLYNYAKQGKVQDQFHVYLPKE